MATFKAGSVIENVLVTATSAGTLTLAIDSPTYLQFTGSTTHTVVLPDATTLPLAKRFYIANRSTGIVSVQYDDASAAVAVDPDTERLLVLVNSGTSNGTWDISTGSGGGGGGGGGAGISVLGDWTDYSGTVTVPACYGTTVDIEYWGKRVGDNLVARGAIQTGTPTGANATWFLPPGLTVDASKFTQNVSDPTRDARHFLGTAYALLNTGAVLDNGPTLAIFYDEETDDIYLTNSTDPGGTREFWIRGASGFINSDEVITFEFQVPILEWANSEVSSSAETAIYTRATNQSVPDSTNTTLLVDTIEFDNSGGQYNPATGVFTALRPGTFQVSGQCSFVANATGYRYVGIVKNGTDFFGTSLIEANTSDISLVTSFTIDLLATDTIELQAFQTSGGALNVYQSQISVARLTTVTTPSPVVVRYTTDAGQSIGSASITVVDFEDVDFDSNSLVTTGASWKMTAAEDGYYSVNAHVAYSTLNTTNNYNIYIYKNGSVYTRGYSAGDGSLIVSDLVQLNATEFVDIRTDQDTGSPVTLDASPASNGVAIWKL